MKMPDMIILAAQFAAKCHEGQVRKYNGLPYITHPIRVAGRVATHPIANRPLVAAAFLHDVVEDCGISFEELDVRFGSVVAHYVGELTNTSKATGLKRAERKRFDRERIAIVSREAKIVKLIDRIDNLREINPDDGFCQLYAKESLLLLEVLKGVDDELENELFGLADSLSG